MIDQEPYVYPYKPIFDRFLTAAERIIVTSPNMRDESSQIANFRRKTEIVPLGVETNDMEIKPRDASERNIIFVGRLVHFKGVKYLISAMKELDASLSIVGKGPRRDVLEQHANKEGVSQKVAFEGFVSDEKLDRLYRNADVFVLPSIGDNESFGIVQLEAMKRGLPVINTALSTGVPYVSVDGMTGITVSPKDPDGIADAASTLFESPELYRRYSINAQQRVQSEFSKTQMVSKTEDIYRNVVALG
jgi:rhamnosyl/mannosyltransferase